MSTYKKVMHFKIWSGFFGPPCTYKYGEKQQNKAKYGEKVYMPLCCCIMR